MVAHYFLLPRGLYLFLFFSCLLSCGGRDQKEADLTIPQRVNELMSKMTLQEKIGQMNQYNGFWNVTGPSPKDGNAKEKYDHLAKGLVGSMLNVRGAREVRAVQEVAVNQSRLGIPLIIGFDLIHGYKTISPIPLAE
jgi:beta-glucosidase